MRSFRDLEIQHSYNTKDTLTIIESFFNPVLSNTVLYKRAVAYFSSTSLVQVARGLDQLIKSGGSIKIITSPNLSEEDIRSIEKGYVQREELVFKKLDAEIDILIKDYSEVANYLAHLIALGRLDIKIVKICDDLSALYHAKIGIMVDSFGNKIAFSGSNNETFSGMLKNYENFDVYKDWDFGADPFRVHEKNEHFDRLWNNSDNRFLIYDFPEAIRKKILKKIKKDYIPSSEIFSGGLVINETEQPYHANIKETLDVPEWFNPYPYQEDAVENWASKGYQGLFSMATGSGKTLTALLGLHNLYNSLEYKNLFIVIVVPYIHMIEQWCEDINEFNLFPINASISKSKWYNKLYRAVSTFNLKSKLKKEYIESVIVTNTTYKSDSFQATIRKLKGNTVIVFDEVHNSGAEGFKEKLLNDFQYRLGLSATIDRHNDEKGTKQIYDYFGEIVQNISMGDAIKYKSLVNYFYYINFVFLDEDELHDYKKITKQLARHISSNSDGSTEFSDSAKMLLIKRARILAGARGKVEILKNLIEKQISKFGDIKRTLVYCGIVTQEADDHDEFERQIETVNKMLYKTYDLKIKKFTSDESLEVRRKIKHEFEKNEIDVISAMKCLDEGVNIPQIQHAYILSSSTNPREFIQRRGRVLRKFPGKKYAYINDFIVLPTRIEDLSFLSDEELRTEVSIVIRELKRVLEFAKYAENSFDVMQKITKVYEGYKHIMDEKGVSIYD